MGAISVSLDWVEGLDSVDPAPPTLRRPLTTTAPGGLDVTALPEGTWLFGAAPVTKTEELAFAVSADRRLVWFDTAADGRLDASDRVGEPEFRGGLAWFRVRGTVRQPLGEVSRSEVIPMRVGITLSGEPASLSRLDVHRRGRLEAGGRTLEVAVIDRTFRGWFSHLGRDELLVDVDGDGAFDISEESHERYRLGSPFPCGDLDLMVSTVGLFGSTLEVVPAPKPARRAPPLLVGAPAPGFEAQDLAGKPVTLEGYRGRWVLLDYWATWCAPCRAELPNLKALRAALPAVEILGISADRDRATLEAFLAAQTISWPQVHDTDGRLAGTYRVRSYPRSYLVAPDGTIAAKDLRGPAAVDVLRRLIANSSPAPRP